MSSDTNNRCMNKVIAFEIVMAVFGVIMAFALAFTGESWFLPIVFVIFGASLAQKALNRDIKRRRDAADAERRAERRALRRALRRAKRRRV